jgi:hypothetical protein
MTTYPKRRFTALDLGQRADHSAFALIERDEIRTGEFDRAHWRPVTRLSLSLRILHRWPLGTPYLEVVRWTRDILREFAPQSHPTAPLTFAIDAAGPGAPVYEIIRAARTGAFLQPVIITSGVQPSQAKDSTLLVPRDHLLAQLRLSLERSDLRISDNLPLAQPLRDELAALGQPHSSSTHDDLAIAVALATWTALRFTPALRRAS